MNQIDFVPFAIYVYETIPVNPGVKPSIFRIQQSIKERGDSE
jgi:hypothetical protein